MVESFVLGGLFIHETGDFYCAQIVLMPQIIWKIFGKQKRQSVFALPFHFASHSLVIGTAAAFGRDPVDDLIRVGDVAGFAVDAV